MWHLCWVFKWHLWRWGLKGARYQTLDTGWSSSASLGLPCCVFRLRHRVSSSARGVCFFPNWRYCCGDKNGKVVPRGSLRCTESSLGHQIYADMPWKCEVGRTNTFAGKSFRISTESEMSSLQILLRWVPAGSPLLCSRLPILIWAILHVESRVFQSTASWYGISPSKSADICPRPRCLSLPDEPRDSISDYPALTH